MVLCFMIVVINLLTAGISVITAGIAVLNRMQTAGGGVIHDPYTAGYRTSAWKF